MAILAILIQLALYVGLYFLLSARRGKEYANVLIATYIWGAVMLLPAMVFEGAVFSFVQEIETSVPLLLFASFIATAGVETVLLFLALYADTKRARHYRRRFDGVLIALALFGGFALAETVQQIFTPLQAGALLRYLTGFPTKLCCGALMGWFYGRTKDYPVPLRANNALAILLPWLLQGVIETGVVAEQNGYAFGLPVLLIALLPALGATVYFVGKGLRGLK